MVPERTITSAWLNSWKEEFEKATCQIYRQNQNIVTNDKKPLVKAMFQPKARWRFMDRF